MAKSKDHQPPNRQLGITEPPPEHLVLAALQLLPTDAQSCQHALEQLRTVVRAELQDQLADPATETGELGYDPHHGDSGLLVTVGFATSAYDKLGTSADHRPRDLQPIPPDVLDSSGNGQGAETPGEGDVLLKICSDDIYVAEHVIRRIEHELANLFSLVWVQTGVQRYNTRQSKNPRHESRALIGFLDGTKNLNPALPEDRALIFTDHTHSDYPPLPTSDQYNGASFPTNLRPPPTAAEPAELDGGSYLAVEVLVTKTADFDQQAVSEQERVIGRQKEDGSDVVPADPASHVQKANPNRPGTDDLQRRVLRRGYALLQPRAGGLARGLVFLAFGRSLSAQAEFIRRAWMNNPHFPEAGSGADRFMSQYVEPRLLCGGYYFVPPLGHASQSWSWRVPGSNT